MERLSVQTSMNSRNKDPTKMYYEGTHFVDHASSMIDMYHHISLGSPDTIRSTDFYELKSEELGIQVKY